MSTKPYQTHPMLTQFCPLGYVGSQLAQREGAGRGRGSSEPGRAAQLPMGLPQVSLTLTLTLKQLLPTIYCLHIPPYLHDKP